MVKEKLPEPVLRIKMFLSPPYASPVMKQAFTKERKKLTALKSSQHCLGKHVASGRSRWLQTAPEDTASPLREGLRGCRGEQPGLKREGQARRGSPKMLLGVGSPPGESKLLAQDDRGYTAPNNSTTLQHSKCSQQLKPTTIRYLKPTG